MNMSRFLSVMIPVSSLMASCVTTTETATSQRGKTSKVTSHSSSIAPVGAPTTKTSSKKPAKSVSVEAEYSVFFSRVAIPEKEYSEKDRQQLLGFAPVPQAGTIHEAAIVVGILRDIVTPVGGVKSTFKEVDVVAGEGANKKDSTAVIASSAPKVDPSSVLEIRCREKGVDCISALASNPHLRSNAIYTMAWEASRKEGNSPLFIQNLSTVLKSEIEAWGDLARRLGLEVQPVPSTTPNSATTPVAGEVTPETSGQAPQGDITAAAVTATESQNAMATQLMAKALELAGKEDYEKAVLEARKISEGTDNYPSAQENIKIWANKAVQELRRQAANQYRSSSATNEPSGKKAYLSKAKGYLQSALTKYPEASTLDTVKENLEIINKELDRLN